MCISAQVLFQIVHSSTVFQSFVFYPWQKKETKDDETQRRMMSGWTAFRALRKKFNNRYMTSSFSFTVELCRRSVYIHIYTNNKKKNERVEYLFEYGTNQ